MGFKALFSRKKKKSRKPDSSVDSPPAIVASMNDSKSPSIRLRPQVEELEHVFKKFDVNGDDKISSAELGSIMANLGHQATEDELKTMITEEKGVVFCGREEEKAPEGCGEGEYGGGESRSSSTGREGKWVSKEGCCEGCRGEGCGFLRKRRQPKGVEKKRRQKEKGVDVAWCRRVKKRRKKIRLG